MNRPPVCIQDDSGARESHGEGGVARLVTRLLRCWRPRPARGDHRGQALPLRISARVRPCRIRNPCAGAPSRWRPIVDRGGVSPVPPRRRRSVSPSRATRTTSFWKGARRAASNRVGCVSGSMAHRCRWTRASRRRCPTRPPTSRSSMRRCATTSCMGPRPASTMQGHTNGGLS